MKNKFLTMSIVLLTSTWIFSQNPAMILAPMYNSPGGFTNLPIPSLADGNEFVPFGSAYQVTLQNGQGTSDYIYDYALDGYDGQKALKSQNIIMDNSTNKIMFFIIDGVIYDRKGRFFAIMQDPNYNTGTLGTASNIVDGHCSETTIIPFNCSDFYIISTLDPLGNTDKGLPYYSRIRINYDANDNVLSDSKIFKFDNIENPNQDYYLNYTAKNLADLVGTSFYTNPDQHGERPLYAVTKEINGVKYLFFGNFNKIFRFKVEANQLTYDNYSFNLSQVSNNINNLNFTSNFRQEMEVISLTNGNFRIAYPIKYSTLSPAQNNTGVFVMDFSSNGVYIPNSLKEIRYPVDNNNSNGEVYIYGLEFAQGGERLYVSHRSSSLESSILNYFDLTSSLPTKQVINVSNVADFDRSQIESLPNNELVLVAHNRLSKITNASTAVFPGDFVNNFQTLTNYSATFLSSGQIGNENTRLLQDNIDDFDYAGIINPLYTVDYFTAQANATWTATQNPFNNQAVVTVKNELRIPAGKNITIRNMLFKFSPGARVIIERVTTSSYGGTLTLDGTTFTADTQCEIDMWLGVEVYGNNNFVQGVPFFSKQGTLRLINNSVIEHAYIGALASKRNPNATTNFSDIYTNTFDGGIIQATNSTFNQNQIGVYIPKYNSTGNNLCQFTQSTFQWNGPLLNPSENYLYQAAISSTKGVLFRGNSFINLTPIHGSTLSGMGVYADNSIFSVLPYCQNLNCTSYAPNRFKGFYNGIYVTNYNLNTFVVDRSEFVENRYGIVVINATYEKITRNLFKVYESNTFQSAGLVLKGSTGYTVSENNFTNHTNTNPITNAQDYGIVVTNSGTSHNEIYKNTFWNLKIGGQSELINGSQIANANDPLTTGLQWKCNTFNERIVTADLTVVKGRIDYHQGYPFTSNANQALLTSARNKFSRNSEGLSLLHDINVDAISQEIAYVYLADASHRLDSYEPLKIYAIPALYGLTPVYMSTNGCETVLDKSAIQLQDEITNAVNAYNTENIAIVGGASSVLLDFVNTTNNLNQALPLLLELSPYLSDEILIAYIHRNPSAGHLKQVLLANSSLSAKVKEELQNANVPIGTKNQVLANQSKISPRDVKYQSLSYISSLESNAYNQWFNLLQMDSTGIDKFIVELEISPKIAHKRDLLEIYLKIGDLAKEQALKDQLQQDPKNAEFLNLFEIQKLMKDASNESEVTLSNPELIVNIENLASDTSDILVQEKAIQLFYDINEIAKVDSFLLLDQDKSLFSENITSNEISVINNFVSIYPNPSTGLVNLDFANIPDGVMEIKLYDLAGKLVYQNTFVNTNGEQINLAEMHKGLYLVKILIDKQVVEVQKLELK